MSETTDWTREGVAARRDRYYAPTQKKFVPYAEPMIFKRGQGQYLWDENGNEFIDLLGMNVCVSVGHAHPEIVRAAMEQAAELTHCTTMFYHPVPAHYAEELAATFPVGYDWVVHLTNSGGEAVDLALTMARAYSGNIDFLSLRNAYHGPTAGAQSLTGIAGFRHRVPQLPGVAFVAEPNQYRGALGEGVEPYLDEIDRTIDYETCGKLAGIIIEPIQGYGGIVPMPPGYIAGAAERVRARGGVLVIDEVQSGVGRTGKVFWAFESHDVIPDIVVVAKGVGNGFPLAAVVARRHVAEAMADKFVFHTYGANPVACAAGRAVLRVHARDCLMENADLVGAALLERLKALKQRHPAIGDVRGEGLMVAVEIVKDRRTKEPDPEATARVFEEARKHGLVLSKSGPYRSVLRLAPPLCLSLADTDRVAEGLDRSFATL